MLLDLRFWTTKPRQVLQAKSLARRPQRYAFKGKTKQIGTWGTGTSKPPIRRILVAAVRRPKRYKPVGRVVAINPIRTFGALRFPVPTQVIHLTTKPRLRPVKAKLLWIPRSPIVAVTRHTKAILTKLVIRPKQYKQTGKFKQIGARGTSTTKTKPQLFKLLLADQRKQVRGRAQLGKVVRIPSAPVARHVQATLVKLAKQRKPGKVHVLQIKPIGRHTTVKPPVRAIKVVGIRRPARNIFKGKAKQIGSFGGDTRVVVVRLPRHILTVLAHPSRRYWKKVRKQVLSDHLASLTGKPPVRPVLTLLATRPRRYTVNKGKVIRIKRFGSASRKPPIYKIKVVSLIKRMRKLPQTTFILGNVVRTFGVTAPPQGGVYIPTIRRHRR